MTKKIITVSTAVCAAALASAQTHPNVLFILTDDQGWGDVGIHGNKYIETPAINSLYQQSVVMDRFMASPLSAPTRASILTGRYHLRTGVSSVQSGLENMNPEETTMAELFREAGYATGCFGKWHNGTYYPYTPNGQGFDEFLGFCCGHWANYFNPVLQVNEDIITGEGYITDIFTDAAIRFIEDHKDGPFFCYVPYNAPHSPFQVPDEYYNHYKDIPAANERDQKILASIYGMVECVDRNISRLLDVLDRNGLRENTIVVYMSDNGPVHVERYNGGMKGGKGTVHEGGVRVPCYFNWEGHLEHRIVTEPHAHIDLLPTLMELCGIKDYTTAFPLDGISMAPALRGEPDPYGERKIFTHRRMKEMQPFVGAVRTDRYRLAVLGNDDVRLYDMFADPGQHNDIFSENEELGRSLYEDYKAWYGSASKGVAETATVVPVGYPQAPQVRIPAPEGEMHGRLKCYGYPNQNWVNHFMEEEDSICFTIGVVNPGKYSISVEYSNSSDEGKALVSYRCGKFRSTAELPQFMTEFRYSPDRYPRDEAPDMTWTKCRVGTVKLPAGEYPLKVYVKGVKDKDAVRIKTIVIDKIQ